MKIVTGARKPSYIPQPGDLVRLPNWPEGKLYLVVRVEEDEMLVRTDRGRAAVLSIETEDWQKANYQREIASEIWGTVSDRWFQPYLDPDAARSAAEAFPGHFLACLRNGVLIDVETNEPFDIHDFKDEHVFRNRKKTR